MIASADHQGDGNYELQNDQSASQFYVGGNRARFFSQDIRPALNRD